MAMIHATSSEVIASSIVTGSFSSNVSRTARPSRTERPKSPRATWLSHSRYRTCIGRSSPISFRSALSASLLASSPSRTRAGSPGMRLISENTMRLTKNRTGRVRRRRRTRYQLTAEVDRGGGRGCPPPQRLRVQPGIAEPHHAVRDVHEPLEFGAQHFILFGPIEEQVRLFVIQDIHHVAVCAPEMVARCQSSCVIRLRVLPLMTVFAAVS